MQNIKYYTWEVIPTNTPLLKKKCSKCKCNSHFYCSNKFRLNSQKRYIDVWLIYKCVKCDETYNLPIFSRTKPDLIDKNLFQRFSENDEIAAWQYAFDTDILSKSNFEADYSHIDYDIIYEKVSLDEMLEIEEEMLIFEIKAKFYLHLKLTSVIRECLGISLSQLDRMMQAGVISILPLGKLKKMKVKDGVKVVVYRNKLKRNLENL